VRITDIIRPDQGCRLRHPTVGDVLWTDQPGDGFALRFARGPEKGWTLVADAAVLLDDCWEAIAPEEAGEILAEPLCRAAPEPRDFVPDPAALSSRWHLAEYVERLRSNPLEDPELWEHSAGEFLHQLRAALGCMNGFPPEDRSGIDTEVPSWPLFAWVVSEASVLLRTRRR
jgi:hypothetical protein